ncbi:unnamed protein product [Rangifer tarandus platyrhynchus]|uniref:Uncharacterized protein n=2 Tax=Rangifer tarandus platyrhynchus TaxID=3082113 RepID=A0ABN8ZTR8_RANTA|nr:unnamed protein product [Rangifer tarandus platyrhynchus]CAI9707096.1 unnamed protein product [Rangifer tarandus platyrhynchus]
MAAAFRRPVLQPLPSVGSPGLPGFGRGQVLTKKRRLKRPPRPGAQGRLCPYLSVPTPQASVAGPQSLSLAICHSESPCDARPYSAHVSRWPGDSLVKGREASELGCPPSGGFQGTPRTRDCNLLVAAPGSSGEDPRSVEASPSLLASPVLPRRARATPAGELLLVQNGSTLEVFTKATFLLEMMGSSRVPGGGSRHELTPLQ